MCYMYNMHVICMHLHVEYTTLTALIVIISTIIYLGVIHHCVFFLQGSPLFTESSCNKTKKTNVQYIRMMMLDSH